MWKYLLIMCIVVSAAHAEEYTGIFSILDNKFADSVHDLPTLTPHPDMKIQRSGNIKGWVDIVGFKQMIREHDIYYVNGRPKDYAIVMYDAKLAGEADCGSCSIVYVKHRVTISDFSNTTTALDNIELKWKKIIILCDTGGCWANTIYHTDHATFQDSEISPQSYNVSLNNFIIKVAEYNNTISPKVNIAVPEQSEATKITVSYNGSSAIHYLQTGTIQVTNKNVPYLSMTDTDYWIVTGFSRFGNVLMVNGTTIDYKKLQAQESTPFQTVNSKNYSKETFNYSPEQTWNPVFFLVIGTVSIFGWGINKFMRI